MQAVLVSNNISYDSIRELKDVDCQDYELAVVVGVFEEVDPDNKELMPICKVWESSKVIYIET